MLSIYSTFLIITEHFNNKKDSQIISISTSYIMREKHLLIKLKFGWSTKEYFYDYLATWLSQNFSHGKSIWS